MKEHDNAELWTALTIGAVVGIGAALLLRSRQAESDRILLRRRLRPLRRGAERVTHVASDEVRRRTRQASDAGAELAEGGREFLHELQRSARDIVRAAREELRRAAQASAADARKAAQRARRSLS